MRPLSSLRATMRTSPAGRSSVGAGEPAVDGGGGGEEADAGQLSVAPGVVGLALLEAELDAAAVEFARHDAHGRAVAAGVVFLGGGGGGHDGAAQDGEQGDDRRAGAAPVTAGACWRVAGPFVEAGRDGMAGSCADRVLPLGQPGGSSPVDITDTPDIAGCAVWPMAGSRGEDRQESCHTGISTPRGGPWRTSNVDGILRSLRLDRRGGRSSRRGGR